MAEPRIGSDLPPMVPDRDELRANRPASGGGKPPGKPRPAGGRSTGGGGGSASLLSIVLFLVLLVALIAMALMVYSQNQLLASYEERLELADERIVTLEQAMSETDESVAMNENAINAQFRSIREETELHMSEIRKLWDVSNVRNRDWIEGNQEAIGQLQSGQQETSERISSVSANLDQQRQRLESLSGTLSDTEESLQQRLASVQASIDALNGQQSGMDPAAMEERLLNLTLTQENLLLDLGDISATQLVLRDTLDNISETIESIDASRLDTNRRMVALSERLQALEEQAAGGL
ncbi:MAG: zinc ribbon domain-containing protein [Saccharospirillum sp.]